MPEGIVHSGFRQATKILPRFHGQADSRAEGVLLEVSPPGEPIPIKVEPFDLDDLIPEEAETRVVMAGLYNGRAGGTKGVQ